MRDSFVNVENSSLDVFPFLDFPHVIDTLGKVMVGPGQMAQS